MLAGEVRYIAPMGRGVTLPLRGEILNPTLTHLLALVMDEPAILHYD